MRLDIRDLIDVVLDRPAEQENGFTFVLPVKGIGRVRLNTHCMAFS